MGRECFNMDDRNRKIRQIVTFLLITFASSLLFALLCPWSLMDQTRSSIGTTIYTFFPAFGTLLTRKLYKEPFTYRTLWLESPSGKGGQYSLIGWYGVFLILVIGHVTFFLFHRAVLNIEGDLTNVRYTLAMTVLVAPAMLSGVFLMGEELGWRGYLLPKMTAVWGVVPATIVIGVIWACWHIPLLVIADQTGPVHYGGALHFNWLQMLITVYIPLCLAMSMICSFVTLKSGTAFAAGCAHASYNTYISTFNVFINYGKITGFSIDRPFYYSILLMLIIGVPMMVHLHRLEKQGNLDLRER